MRPDRAIMIGHRVEARLGRCKRANTPARKRAWAHQGADQPFGALGPGNTGPEGMTRIRGTHATRALLAIERKRIAAEVLAPEGKIKAHRQFARLLAQACRPPRLAERLCHRGGTFKSTKGIGLHLAYGDRPFGQTAIGMRDAVETVLPALVQQPLLGPPTIFDKAILITVTMVGHPLERRFQIGPDIMHGPEIPGPLKIGPRQHDEERRRIHAAIVM